MTEPVLPPALGNYAADERFWDREREVAELAAYLRDGQSMLVIGPRRVGKTSVVRRVLDELRPSHTVVFIDVEQHANPAAMFAALAAEASREAGFWPRLIGRLGKRLGVAADRVGSVDLGVLKVELQAAMAAVWQDDARSVIASLAEGDQPAVVAVDELPLLVDRVLRDDPAGAEVFLGVLRGMAEEFRNVRWLVSGSIGLEPVLHRAGLTGTVTHLRSYPIDAWDEPTTAGAAAALGRAAGLDLAGGAAAAVHQQLGLGVPYHVQLLMDEVRRDAARRADSAVTADDVARVYGGPFLSSAVRAHLLHLESRLDKVLGEGDALRLARDLLTQAAVADRLTADDAMLLARDLVEDGADRPALLRHVLEILENDAYLSRDDNGWSYRSRVVRDWWRQTNQLGFVLAADRSPQP